MSILGSIALAAASTFIPGAGIAIAIYRYGKDVVLAALKRAASYLFLHPMTAVAIAAGLLSLFWWQDARHWKKADAGDVAARHDVERVLGGVKAEVDRGVGKPTRAEDGAFYVRRFVDNVNTLKGINARDEAGIRQSHADDVAARAGAHQDAQPTAGERDRDKVRQRIADPARTTGLTADEWSQL